MSGVHDAGRLHQLDVNLLVALDVLLQERGVTRAATRLGLTQSAMSHTLRRLRDALDDPLFVRGAGSMMVATPRALAMEVPLRSALGQLARLVDAPPSFEPRTAKRVFRLVSPDLFDALVLPQLLVRVAGEAPNVSVTVAPGFHDIAARLETGDLDVAVIPTLLDPAGARPLGPEPSPDLHQRRLLEDRFRAFVRADHPVLNKQRLTVRAFAALHHVLVSPTGRGDSVVDPALTALGLERHVALRVPHFASAIAVIQQSDLALVAPGALAVRATALGIAELKLPLELPRHVVSVVWHPRFDADPGHRWFRDVLAASAAPLEAG